MVFLYFVANSLKEVESGQMAKMGPNVGLNIQFPYYPVGPVDISPGLRFMTYSYEANHLGSLKALQIGGICKYRLKTHIVLFSRKPSSDT